MGSGMTAGIEFYASPDGDVSLEVRTDDETVWLTQNQIADLFQTTQQNVSGHLLNVYEEGELDETATHKDFLSVRREGTREVKRAVAHYNLDAILSVGYRVRSRTATQFRIWATQRLRDYLVRGFVQNERRLAEIGRIVTVLARSDDRLVAGVADVLAGYVPGLTILRDYDAGQLEPSPATAPEWTLTIEEARQVIAAARAHFADDTLFGRERGDALAGVIGTVYQGFAGHELYPTVEEKAANLLYLVVKDHPLSDGNKRSGAALFVTFLARNGQLTDAAGRSRISNNALAAMTLMVAMSDPKEKDLMIDLLVRMLTEADE